MREVVIIHFQPVELYPPVINLVNYLAAETGGELKVQVLTLHAPSHIQTYQPAGTAVTIHRMGKITPTSGALQRYFTYLRFYLWAVYKTLTFRPAKILSFETLSFFPVYIYRRFFKRKVEIMVHYHEYTTLQEYHEGMKLSKWMHEMEKELYPEMKWISHTNALRMQRFVKDHQEINIPNRFILPNYPPVSWKQARKVEVQERIKIVYVGALGWDTMYVREFARWVDRNRHKVSWDIYSNNAEDLVLDYLGGFDETVISMKGAIPYQQLPEVLKNYHVGVILYKGHIQNYVLNSPNKLFEYLACGLDVWFPDVMTGSLPYVTRGVYPLVAALPFDELLSVNLENLTDKKGLTFKPSEYFAEQVLPELATHLLA